ncbi:MAG TPA: hypothetical protein VNW46_13030 [Gemmatimonadaceae bacterium]|nr:hypothetical protein [Gemmatimonadaceae bacterium]
MRASLSMIGIIACAAVFAACGSSTSPTSSFPNIAGQYAATATYRLQAGTEDSTAVLPGTIAMQNANRAGQFTGTWHIQGSGADTATGAVVGQFGSDTSTISWIAFGDGSGAQPLYVVTIFQLLYPNCNVAAARALQPATGSILGTQLTITNTFSGFQCKVGVDSVLGTLSAQVTATKS